jgi:hypothetical protein
MILEHGTSQFTLITTRLFDNYDDVVQYWARRCKYYEEQRNRYRTDAEPPGLFAFVDYGMCYSAKSGDNPKRIDDFHRDVKSVIQHG